MSHEVPSHPKVQIETKEDILFVRDQLEKTINSTIDLKKRQCGKDMKDSDLVFTKVQENMTRWMEQIFAMAGPNIQVNNVDYEHAMKVEQEYEPYEESLRQTVDELYGQMVDALVKFTTVRRQVLMMLPNLNSTQETIQKETFDTLLKAIAKMSDPQEELLPKTKKAVHELDMDQLKSILLSTSQNVEQVNEMIQSLDVSLLSTQVHQALSFLSLYEKQVPTLLNKLERAEGLLNNLGIQNVNKENTNMDWTETCTTPRRAKSTLLQQLKK